MLYSVYFFRPVSSDSVRVDFAMSIVLSSGDGGGGGHGVRIEERSHRSTVVWGWAREGAGGDWAEVSLAGKREDQGEK